jgi:hypothetical protein
MLFVAVWKEIQRVENCFGKPRPAEINVQGVLSNMFQISQVPTEQSNHVEYATIC